MEFALADQNPTVPTSATPLRLRPDGFEFTRNPDASAEVIYRIYSSSDLAAWGQLSERPPDGNWNPFSGVIISESVGNSIDGERRSSLGGTHYYRLQITIP